MKIIPLITVGTFSVKEIMTQILSLSSPNAPLNVGAIRQRVNLIDKFSRGGASVLLEDAEYNFLKETVTNFTGFAVANADLLAIIDAVLNAKTYDMPHNDTEEVVAPA